MLVYGWYCSAQVSDTDVWKPKCRSSKAVPVGYDALGLNGRAGSTAMGILIEWMMAVQPPGTACSRETNRREVRAEGTPGVPRAVLEDVRLRDAVREGTAKERSRVETTPRGKVDAGPR